MSDNKDTIKLFTYEIYEKYRRVKHEQNAAGEQTRVLLLCLVQSNPLPPCQVCQVHMIPVGMLLDVNL